MMQDPFIAHRNLLFTVAYEMLGSAADAEDVVQESWLRWDSIDKAKIGSPRAYLVRMVTRQSLNRLRSESRRREDYVGPWLPEPLLTTPDVADDVELAESVSFAMLTVLETLGPTERVVFVLRDVFDTPYHEIADILSKTPEAVRQIAHRARKHVAAKRPRIHVDPDEQRAVVEKFLSAVSTGDVESLIEVLAPEVVAIADGGGVVPALRSPVSGAAKLANLLVHFASTPGFEASVALLNGSYGVRIEVDGRSIAVMLSVEHGRVTQIHAIANPRKLGKLNQTVKLQR